MTHNVGQPDDPDRVQREIRLLKFSNFLQVIAFVAFTGAGLTAGFALGWNLIAFLLIFLGVVNLGFFFFTRVAISARKQAP